MTTRELAVKVRKWLRIGSEEALEEIEQCICACQFDLQGGGVDNVSLDDPLIQQAVKDYCKSHFGFESEAERYAAAYEKLKCGLAMNVNYAYGINLRAGDENG